jgi:Tfp pilus assembly protein PilF
MASGEYTQSIEKLKRAVDLDPQSRAAIYSLAIAYEKSGQSEKGSAAWKRFQALAEKQKHQLPEQRLVYTLNAVPDTKR